MSDAMLSAIYRYPVKSLRGQAFERLDVGRRGLDYDRQWMVVDPEGRFLTQRQQPRMSLIDAAVDDDGGLQLSAPGMPMLVLPRGQGGASLEVTVWGDQVSAGVVSDDADAWLSDFLGQACRLVVMPDTTRRAVDPQFASTADEVGFADGFPFLLISQASLDDLNHRLATPVPMLRFRPNLVVSDCTAFAEDSWKRIRIGGLVFRVAKPCSRCVIPTIDFTTGESAREPLQTLMQYRRRDNKVYFGQNLVHEGGGSLEVGLPVEILE
jgi:uncharacterized protein YcbX